VRIDGTKRVEPAAGGGCRHRVEGKRQVKIPLIGGRIASWAEGPSQQRLDAEPDFHRARLRD
jgi:hypothetical protein